MEKKRTQQQIDEAKAKGDYTGGYQTVIAFILYRRIWIALAALFPLTPLVILILDPASASMPDIYISIFGVAVTVLIFALLKNEFKNLKKGITS